MALKRIVVTGLSTVTPLGPTLSSTFEGLLNKKSGLRNLTESDFAFRKTCEVKTAGLLDSWDQKYWFGQNSIIKAFVNTLSLCTTSTAIADSKWKPETLEQCDRTGVIFGSTRTNSFEYSKYLDDLFNKNIDRMERLIILKCFPPIIGGAIGIVNKFSGFSYIDLSGSVSGLNTVAEGYKAIALGEADVIVVGSVECPLDSIMLDGYKKADQGMHVDGSIPPDQASRPFDKSRKGWVPSIGSAAIVLEELEHALKRGANIYAEVTGYGSVTDLNDSKTTTGYERAMNRATKGKKIDLIFADASGHIENDAGEAEAIEKLHGSSTRVTSTKGGLGHMFSASSSVNVAIAAHSIKSQLAPPCTNLEDPIRSLNFIQTPSEAPFSSVLINAANYDGNIYSSVVLEKFNQ